MEKEPFDNDLNVPRQELLDAIYAWLRDPHPEYRLRSIVGTAGIGKSWFMTGLYQRLWDDSQFHVIWLDMSQSATDPFDKEKNLPDCRTEDGRCAWLKKVAQDSAAKYTPDIFVFQPDAPFVSNFREFVNVIGRRNPPVCVLLVDGYDEVLVPDHQDFLQEHILSRFWGGNNTRILLARRDEDIISHPILSWNDDPVRLKGFQESQSREQVQRRAKNTKDIQITPDRIPQIFAPYFSTNPFINTFLFNRLIKNTPLTLKSIDIDACATAVISRAGLSSNHLQLAKNIAQTLQEEWTARELSDILTIDLEDATLSDLFKAGIVYQIPGTAKYRIEEGLYGLL